MTTVNEFASNFSYIPYNSAVRLSEELYVVKLPHTLGQYEQDEFKLQNISNHLYLLSSLENIIEVVITNDYIGVEYENKFYSHDEYMKLKNDKLNEFGYIGEDDDENLLFDTVTGERAYAAFNKAVVRKYDRKTTNRPVSVTLIASVLDVPSKKYIQCLLTSKPRVIMDKDNTIKELHCYSFKRTDVLEDAFENALDKVRQKHNFDYKHHYEIKFRTIDSSYVFSKSLDFLKGNEAYYGTFEEIENKVKQLFAEAYEHFYSIMLSCVIKYSETDLPLITLLHPISDVMTSLYNVQCRNKASTDEISKAIRTLKSCKDKITKFTEAN